MKTKRFKKITLKRAIVAKLNTETLKNIKGGTRTNDLDEPTAHISYCNGFQCY